MTTTYIDCYLVPVPRAHRTAYEALARVSAQVAKACGALRVVECWLDEAGPDASSYHEVHARLASESYSRSFAGAAGARDGETVVLAYVEWPDKAARDAGMDRLTRDPRMQFPDQPPVFDSRRLIAAGFCPMPL